MQVVVQNAVTRYTPTHSTNLFPNPKLMIESTEISSLSYLEKLDALMHRLDLKCNASEQSLANFYRMEIE